MSFTYKGLKAQYERHIITNEEVEQQLHRLVRQAPRYTEITDRAAQLGDEVILDFAGFVDGVQFEGGTAENFPLELGSGQFIPGFEDQLVGKAIDEDVSVLVTFPENYGSEALAGKPAEFKCKIHQIRVKSAYELDDTFAKEMGDCDTLEQLRAKVLDGMQAMADEQGEMDLQDELLRQAAETLEFTPDEAVANAEIDRHIEGLRASLAQQGLTLEAYCGFMATDEETLRAEARENVVSVLRMQAAIEEIAKLEQLTASEEELRQALDIICRQNHMTPEQVKPYMDEEFQKALVRSVLASKAMHLIRETAIIGE